MQFFTPDLLIRGNAPDDAVRDAADVDWEAAAAAYDIRLAELGNRLPADARELSDLYLHDGEVLMWGDPQVPTGFGNLARRPAAPSRRSRRSVVAVRLDGVVTSIEYELSGPVRSSPRRKDVPFTARDHVDWLYDEVDVSSASAKAYVHRVLVSDGRELEVPFSSVRIQRVPLSPPSSQRIMPARSQVRQTA